MKFNNLKLVVLGCLVSLSSHVFAKDIDERQASKLAIKKYSAQNLLKVTPIVVRGNKLFQVKMRFSNGRLKTVYVDQKTGKVTEVKP